jgi:hypothetical protein
LNSCGDGVGAFGGKLVVVVVTHRLRVVQLQEKLRLVTRGGGRTVEL